MNTSNASNRPLPIWGILSVAMTPLAALLGAIVALIIEASVEEPAGMTLHTYIPVTTRIVVLGMMACVATGIVSAPIAWLRHERPRWLPALGLATTAFLICLFHFLAVGPKGD
jgi:hypothetical protein